MVGRVRCDRVSRAIIIIIDIVKFRSSQYFIFLELCEKESRTGTINKWLYHYTLSSPSQELHGDLPPNLDKHATIPTSHVLLSVPPYSEHSRPCKKSTRSIWQRVCTTTERFFSGLWEAPQYYYVFVRSNIADLSTRSFSSLQMTACAHSQLFARQWRHKTFLFVRVFNTEPSQK